MPARATMTSRMAPTTPLSEPAPRMHVEACTGTYRTRVGIETKLSSYSAPATNVVFLSGLI